MLRIATALILAATPAVADECFQVIAPVAPAGTVGVPAAVGAIKLNKCTGETWMLSQMATQTSKGAPAVIFKWTPIPVEDSAAVFASPSFH